MLVTCLAFTDTIYVDYRETWEKTAEEDKENEDGSGRDRCE